MPLGGGQPESSIQSSNVFQLAGHPAHSSDRVRPHLLVGRRKITLSAKSRRLWEAIFTLAIVCYVVSQCLGCGGGSPAGQSSELGTQAETRGPLAASTHPNYFTDKAGNILALNGSHTWNDLQDWGSNGSPQPFDFNAYVKFLVAHGHNMTLLWTTELPKFCSFPSIAGVSQDITVSPHPWKRTGPGTATDGRLKFDLTKFNQDYFSRLRSRVQALNTAGIYTGVYLFTGEWLNSFRCASDGYPFTGANNINGISDGYTSGASGTQSMTMTSVNSITVIQDAYVEKVIDTLNDLPNVLWIVSEEAPASSIWWHQHQIAHIKSYEASKPFRHPVGFGALVSAPDTILTNSDADWIAPTARVSPASSCGSGNPPCKVNINDSDHSYFGMWNDNAQQNRNYAWENFLRGNQVVFMDPYLFEYSRENRNLCLSPTNAICSALDSRWENFRNNLGYMSKYSKKLNLASARPHNTLCSTSYCLAQTPSQGAEYLVYAPSAGSFTVDLSAMPSSRTLTVEWFDPSSGATTTGDHVPAGSPSQSFTPPFTGDAVLYLVDTAGHNTAQSNDESGSSGQ